MSEPTDTSAPPLTPGIVAVIDTALTSLEDRFPGVSKDPHVRSDVDARVRAILASAEADTRRALEAVDSTTLTGVVVDR